MGRVVGIDLGTTNCCVSAVVDGKPVVLFDEADAHGLSASVVPSYVKVGANGPQYVGQPAKRDALEDPAGVVFASKRLMGRAFDSEVVQTVINTVSYEIYRGPSHEAMIRVGDVRLSPEDVATELLTYLRQLASARLGEAVTDAVITVPANFNSRQRQATKTAAERAGLTVLRLINEPTAAALVFGHDRSVERTVAVYDLGGGTFDITILEIGEGVYEVLATGGDTFLGGVDFDNRIVTQIIRRDVMPVSTQPIDPISMMRLRAAAEIAKIQLSSVEEAEIYLRSFLDMPELQVQMTRSELETITADIVGRTLQICEQVIADADLQKGDIEELILVGGQTRMPQLRKVVSGFFERWPNVSLNPDEVVAMGAGLHAQALSESDTSTLLLDVTPLTLGIASVGDTFTPILDRNTKVPCSVSREFSTAKDNQKRVKIAVLQGEHGKASKNVLLAEFTLDGIPPAPRFQPRIDVTFRLDANGVLQVTATNLDTGSAQDISIRGFVESVEAAGTDVELKDQAPSVPGGGS